MAADGGDDSVGGFTTLCQWLRQTRMACDSLRGHGCEIWGFLTKVFSDLTYSWTKSGLG